MKKISLLLFVFYLIMSCTSSRKDINFGLVAHYPFDGNASDLSGGNNHLKVDGAVLTTDLFGNENNAYSLNGLTSSLFAEVNNIPAMDSAKTISWWYVSDALPQYDIESGAENMLVLVDSTTGIGIQFGFRAPGYKTRGFDTWQWGGGTFMDMDHPEIKLWHHCLYTYNGTTHSFYIDGEKIASSMVKPKSGIPNQLMLGNYPGGNQFFKGKLDDIRIYNRALIPLEVNTLYQQISDDKDK